MRKLLLIGALGVAFACGSAGNDMVDEVGDSFDDMTDMMDDVVDEMTNVPEVRAQRSKSVSCANTTTYNGSDWLRYIAVDVEDATFPEVWVEVVYASFPSQWCSGQECSGFPAGRSVNRYHVSNFTEDGRAFVTCNGTEESITVFY